MVQNQLQIGDTRTTILSSAKDNRGGVLAIRCPRLRRGPVKFVPVVRHCPSLVLHRNDVRVRIPEQWNCRALTLASASIFGALTYPAAPVCPSEDSQNSQKSSYMWCIYLSIQTQNKHKKQHTRCCYPHRFRLLSSWALVPDRRRER